MTTSTKPYARNGTPPRDAGLADRQLDRAYRFNAGDLATDIYRMIEQAANPEWPLLLTGVAPLDRGLTIAPQTVTVFAGRPSHGKSMWCKALAKRACADIMAQGGYERGERVVYVTLEEPRQKIGAQIGGFSVPYRDIMRGEFDADSAKLEAMGLVKALRPLEVIQHPGMVDGRIAPAVSAGRIMRIIEQAARDDGIRPRLIVLDYLQLMKADGTGLSVRSKTDHVTAASNGAVTLSRTFNCPVVLAVQAGREVDQRQIKIPTMSDMQHASAIEQDADNIIGLWRPAIDYAEELAAGQVPNLDLGPMQLGVTSTLMVMGVIKSRNDAAAGRRFGVHLDPVTHKVFPIVRELGG